MGFESYASWYPVPGAVSSYASWCVTHSHRVDFAVLMSFDSQSSQWIPLRHKGIRMGRRVRSYARYSVAGSVERGRPSCSVYRLLGCLMSVLSILLESAKLTFPSAFFVASSMTPLMSELATVSRSIEGVGCKHSPRFPSACFH